MISGQNLPNFLGFKVKMSQNIGYKVEIIQLAGQKNNFPTDEFRWQARIGFKDCQHQRGSQ